MSAGWITIPALAVLSAVAEQRLRAVASGSLKHGKKWRGSALVVRLIPGRGGCFGLHYEVLISSLPNELQHRLASQSNGTCEPLRHDAKANEERGQWAAALSPALAYPKGSAARGAVVAEIAARGRFRADRPPPA